MGRVLDLQAAYSEVGRIRVGRRDEQGRPEGLEVFRLTSQHRSLLEEAAKRFGGVVREWQNEATTDRYELCTEVSELPVIIPPGPFFTQDYELWTRSGLVRRCDGFHQYDEGRSPCVCPRDRGERARLAAGGDACRPTTRWSVFIAGLPSGGVWRLEARGYEAAEELQASYLQVEQLARQGGLVRGTLTITERQRVREGRRLRYRVPVLLPQVDPEDAVLALAQAAEAAQQAAAAAGVEEAPRHHAVRQEAPDPAASLAEARALRAAARAERGRAAPPQGSSPASDRLRREAAALHQYMVRALAGLIEPAPEKGELADAFRVAAQCDRISDFLAAHGTKAARDIVDEIVRRVRAGRPLMQAAAQAGKRRAEAGAAPAGAS